MVKTVEVEGVSVSHPGKILYPDDGITKLQVVEYFKKVSEYMLPEITDRPLSLVRCPAGRGAKCFFQKNPAQKGKKDGQFLTIRSENDLIEFAQLNVLEFHHWGCRIKQLEIPDRLVFDLDPDLSVKQNSVIKAAKLLRKYLLELGLESFAKSTGGKGLHIVVPLKPVHDWEEVKTFAHALALTLEDEQPEQFISVNTKSKRKGKIFIDWLRNIRDATSIAAYSLRARPGAPVAVPLSWDELKSGFKFNKFNLRNISRRLALKDPWSGFNSLKQKLPKLGK